MYSYARLSDRDTGFVRLIGNGLGNLLFPWARWILATRQHHLTPIAPTWLQIQMGPILRNEPDKRFYHKLFVSPSEQIHGIEKITLLNTRPKITEQAFSPDAQSPEKAIVVFEGLRNQFGDILRDHARVKQELVSIARPEHTRGLEYDFKNSITVHVRMGDFFVTRDTRIFHNGQMGYRIPLSWYADKIEQLRAHFGNLPAHIFSDGTDAELAELLNLKDCARLSFSSSLADMLAMSQANLFIGSASTFSQWASYLGRMPTIWFQGQSRRLYYDHPHAQVECDEADLIPATFFHACEEDR